MQRTIIFQQEFGLDGKTYLGKIEGTYEHLYVTIYNGENKKVSEKPYIGLFHEGAFIAGIEEALDEFVTNKNKSVL